MNHHHQDDCVFCRIVQGSEPSYPVWESATHIAFLSIFPNTPGVTVVIPKDHHDSYAFALPEQVLTDLVLAAKEAARVLEAGFADSAARVGMVFEGYGVNHVHAKLYPLHGTAELTEWRQLESPLKTFSDRYPGHISTHDGELASAADLAAIQAKLCQKA